MPAIIHVITDLGSGGTERMLSRLVVGSRKFQHIVVSLRNETELTRYLRAAGIKVFALGMHRGAPSPLSIVRLARIMRRERPAVIQTWLYHADLLGLVAAQLAGYSHVAWNLRCSNMDLSKYRWSTRLVVKFLVCLSSRPEMVMVNSEAGQHWHAKLGYRPKQWEIVPNGIDAAVFRPDVEARARWRRRLGVDEADVLIGMVARRDPMKDHENMLLAAAETARSRSGLAFVLAGRGVTRNDHELARLADAVGAPVHLIGESDDPAGINAALDIGVLSSAFGEGFPNAVAEAMATAVPCIVTDVGDAASIVGATGMVVPPSNPHALGHAILALVADQSLRKRLGNSARDRIEKRYSLEAAIARYETLWSRLAGADQFSDLEKNAESARLQGDVTSAS